MKWVDRLADEFGSLGFLIGFNVASFLWVGIGMVGPKWWPDPYPSNFYTLVVSWLAINISSLVLWSERRRRERDEALERANRRMLKAMHALLVKADADRERERQMEKSVLALLESQMRVIETLKGEGDRKC